MRVYEIPDPRMPRSIGRVYTEHGAPFLPDYQATIDTMIEDLR